jgi:hypothetical protein
MNSPSALRSWSTRKRARPVGSLTMSTAVEGQIESPPRNQTGFAAGLGGMIQ